jgi:site-specific DNA-methyltransferase (adenine-specific)
MNLINADCIEAMKAMPNNSVDSIVTDPPYELGFMGKSWDASGIAFNIEVWQEALRVLKPGGHLIAFSGSRTYHRMAVAIEDAGFQIRDQIMWVYGSGFPKSLNIAKAIDKSSGFEGEVISRGSSWNRPDSIEGDTARMNASPGEYDIKELSPIAQQWQGWGTALKPAHEPMVLARKPLDGTVANNVLTYGVGGLNIDGTRIGFGDEEVDFNATQINIDKMGYHGAKNSHSTPTYKKEGRFPANFIHDGSDEVLALFPETGKSGVAVRRNGNNAKGMFPVAIAEGSADVGFNDSGSAARFFYCAKASKRDRNEGLDGFEEKKQDESRKEGNVGGDNPRNRGVNERANHHPTVKPTDLMRYLCRLITPPNGTVLDPFMGSGSTGKAAVIEGFDFIGIDQSAEYVEIARARIEWAVKVNK